MNLMCFAHLAADVLSLLSGAGTGLLRAEPHESDLRDMVLILSCVDQSCLQAGDTHQKA